MDAATLAAPHAREIPLSAFSLAGEAFSRAAGAHLVDGNDVRLLRDAAVNYPAWLSAIAAARRHVHFEVGFVTGLCIGRMPEKRLDPWRDTGARCSKRACGYSSGTARCCTRRLPWPTDAGRASARPTSTSRAGSAIASSKR